LLSRSRLHSPHARPRLAFPHRVVQRRGPPSARAGGGRGAETAAPARGSSGAGAPLPPPLSPVRALARRVQQSLGVLSDGTTVFDLPALPQLAPHASDAPVARRAGADAAHHHPAVVRSLQDGQARDGALRPRVQLQSRRGSRKRAALV
jgi:hypothetical protein